MCSVSPVQVEKVCVVSHVEKVCVTCHMYTGGKDILSGSMH